jgi:2-keto-4-pentenoate hydratase/2-oxohepta-3-ene-1,7-dioic acid hydratase in catechol pathway
MKLARFIKDNVVCHGVIEGDAVRFLKGDFLKSVKFTGESVKTDEIRLIAPVTPGKVVAVGLNYLDHIKEFGDRPVPENPTLFLKIPSTVIGPGEAILLPPGYKRVDFEAELAVVISKRCFRIPPKKAGGYILGGICLNDVTERVVQKKDGQWTRGKNYPTFCPVGPYIETEADFANLDIKGILNGEVLQSSNTRFQIWKAAELVSFISQSIPLEPGDIVSTGTPSGVSSMKPGDEIAIEVEKIGRLVNRVESE